MVMTEYEMYRSFTDAGKKQKQQLERLAEINGVPVKRVLQIIRNYEKQKAREDREYKALVKAHKQNNPRTFAGSSKANNGNGIVITT